MPIRLSALQLKLIALIFMFAEHAATYLSELLPRTAPLIFQYGGRIVAPIFFFLAIESFFKTRNRIRYVGRLYLWAAIMQVGNFILAFAIDSILHPSRQFPLGQNIFLSIALGISMVGAIDWLRRQTSRMRMLAGCVAAIAFGLAGLVSEASYIGVLMFIAFYVAYGSFRRLLLTYSALSLLILGWGLTNLQYFWLSEFQWMMILALPLMAAYSGKQGTPRLKYLFYLAYPLHLWVLYTLRYLLQLQT